MEYTNDDDFVPPNHPPCQYGVKCTNTKRTYYCKTNWISIQCQRPIEECKCKGCNDCLLVSCMKKKMGCKLGKGKPGKLCAMVGMNAVC